MTRLQGRKRCADTCLNQLGSRARRSPAQARVRARTQHTRTSTRAPLTCILPHTRGFFLHSLLSVDQHYVILLNQKGWTVV